MVSCPLVEYTKIMIKYKPSTCFENSYGTYKNSTIDVIMTLRDNWCVYINGQLKSKGDINKTCALQRAESLITTL